MVFLVSLHLSFSYEDGESITSLQGDMRVNLEPHAVNVSCGWELVMGSVFLIQTSVYMDAFPPVIWVFLLSSAALTLTQGRGSLC